MSLRQNKVLREIATFLLTLFWLSRSRSSRAGNAFGTRLTRLSITKVLPHGRGALFSSVVSRSSCSTRSPLFASPPSIQFLSSEARDIHLNCTSVPDPFFCLTTKTLSLKPLSYCLKWSSCSFFINMNDNAIYRFLVKWN